MIIAGSLFSHFNEESNCFIGVAFISFHKKLVYVYGSDVVNDSFFRHANDIGLEMAMPVSQSTIWSGLKFLTISNYCIDFHKMLNMNGHPEVELFSRHHETDICGFE